MEESSYKSKDMIRGAGIYQLQVPSQVKVEEQRKPVSPMLYWPTIFKKNIRNHFENDLKKDLIKDF